MSESNPPGIPLIGQIQVGTTGISAETFALSAGVVYALVVEVEGLVEGFSATVVDQNGAPIPGLPVFTGPVNAALADPNVNGATTTSLAVNVASISAGIATFNINATPV